jgi:hypothetical protein
VSCAWLHMCGPKLHSCHGHNGRPTTRFPCRRSRVLSVASLRRESCARAASLVQPPARRPTPRALARRSPLCGRPWWSSPRHTALRPSRRTSRSTGARLARRRTRPPGSLMLTRGAQLPCTVGRCRVRHRRCGRRCQCGPLRRDAGATGQDIAVEHVRPRFAPTRAPRLAASDERRCARTLAGVCSPGPRPMRRSSCARRWRPRAPSRTPWMSARPSTSLCCTPRPAWTRARRRVARACCASALRARARAHAGNRSLGGDAVRGRSAASARGAAGRHFCRGLANVACCGRVPAALT